MARGVRRCKEIADLNGPIRGVDVARNLAHQRDRDSTRIRASLIKNDARPITAATGDDTGNPLVIGGGAIAEATLVAQDHDRSRCNVPSLSRNAEAAD
jgi:hypothetical protein